MHLLCLRCSVLHVYLIFLSFTPHALFTFVSFSPPPLSPFATVFVTAERLLGRKLYSFATLTIELPAVAKLSGSTVRAPPRERNEDGRWYGACVVLPGGVNLERAGAFWLVVHKLPCSIGSFTRGLRGFVIVGVHCNRVGEIFFLISAKSAESLFFVEFLKSRI